MLFRSRLDKLARVITPELEMKNANTGERIKCTFFTSTGYDMDAIEALNWFMRDWRQKEAKQIDVRVLWALAALRRAGMQDGFHGEIRFLSGYRSRKTNDLLRRRGYGAARNSLHIDARAVDFSLPGMSVTATADYAAWLQVGGVGYYPGSFVHIDSGSIRRWTG